MFQKMQKNSRVNKRIMNWLTCQPNPKAVMNLYVSE